MPLNNNQTEPEDSIQISTDKYCDMRIPHAKERLAYLVYF